MKQLLVVVLTTGIGCHMLLPFPGGTPERADQGEDPGPTDHGLPVAQRDGSDAGSPCKWAVRRQLTFDKATTATGLEDFPVLVVLNNTRVDYTRTRTAGHDLRFTDSDGATVIPHEIENWDPNGKSQVWVKVPRIDANDTTDHIWVYYDAEVPDGERAPAVWNSDYRAVWHLHDDVRDSTSNGVDGTNNGSLVTPGHVAGGHSFDGKDDFIDAGNPTPINNIFAGGGTFEAWIYLWGWGEKGWGRIVDKASTVDTPEGYEIQVDHDNDCILLEAGFSSSRGQWCSPDRSIRLGAWQHVAITYNQGSSANDPSIYIDGKPQEVREWDAPAGSPQMDDSLPLHIGNFSGDTTRTFDGVLDEVRFSKGIRSADWISAQYQSMTDAFITYGQEQPAAPGCPK